MNTQAETQNRVLWGVPIWLTRYTLESLKKRGQIIMVEGVKYALHQDCGKATLHKVAMV